MPAVNRRTLTKESVRVSEAGFKGEKMLNHSELHVTTLSCLNENAVRTLYSVT